MTVKGIPFSTPMIQALLEGRKTKTRRILKPQPIRPEFWAGTWVDAERELHAGHMDGERSIAPYIPGDLLYAREAISRRRYEDYSTCHYPATCTAVPARGSVPRDAQGRALWRWKVDKLPSIYCPRWASRITLDVTEVRIERLHDISRADAAAEGVCLNLDGESFPEWFRSDRWPEENYSSLWEHLHGKGSWLANPWVVVLTFNVIKQNVADVLQERIAA